MITLNEFKTTYEGTEVYVSHESILGLVLKLGLDPMKVTITKSDCTDDDEITINGAIYWILEDDRADALAREILDDYFEGDTALIETTLKTEGRAAQLACYDQKEIEYTIEGETFYAYRVG